MSGSRCWRRPRRPRRRRSPTPSSCRVELHHNNLIKCGLMIDWSQKRSDDRCHRPREQGRFSLCPRTEISVQKYQVSQRKPCFHFFSFRVQNACYLGFRSISFVVFSSSPRGGRGADETSKPKRVTQPFRGHQKAGARRHQRASIGGGGRARAGGREREGRARRHSSGEFTGRDVVKRERARAWLP